MIINHIIIDLRIGIAMGCTIVQITNSDALANRATIPRRRRSPRNAHRSHARNDSGVVDQGADPFPGDGSDAARRAWLVAHVPTQGIDLAEDGICHGRGLRQFVPCPMETQQPALDLVRSDGRDEVALA